MDSVNDKTRAAVKLTRTDAVKLVSAELVSLYADEIKTCYAETQRARLALHDEVQARAWAARGDDLRLVVGDVPSVKCTYRVYNDGSDDGDYTEVIFSDSPKTFDARNKATVTVTVDRHLREEWILAETILHEARERDRRASAMTREARETLIKSALADTPEGAELIRAVRALAAVVKG